MADKKISQLTAVTTPLTGAEELPAVQSATTKKVTVLELQAAPVSVGSANAVQYLNASKVPSTSTAFTFDGVSVSAPVSIVNSGFSGGRYEINFAAAAVDSRTWKIQTDYSAFGAMSIVTAATQGGAVTKEIMQFAASGNANLYLGNLVIGTAGKGIDFSANGGDVLSQYDEGTFTPAWGGSGGDPTCSYTSQTGRYTRVGNIVYCWVEIVTSASSGGSGNLQIKGLPFNARDAELNAGFASGFSLNFPSGCFANSTTTVTMTNTVPGVEQAYLGIGTLGASSYLACTIMYRIA